MSITTTCSGCKSLFRLPENLAGKKVRCQKCREMFLVPGPRAEEPPAPIPEASQPVGNASTPEPVSEAPAPPTVATEPAVASTAAAEPIADATLAPVEPAPPRKPLPPERAPSVLVSLALLVLFFLGLAGIGVFSGIWVATKIRPAIHVSAVPPLRLGEPVAGIDKLKDFNQFLPANVEFVVPGADGVVLVGGRLDDIFGIKHGKWNQEGPYKLYQMSLNQGTTYHFWVDGFGMRPRLRIVDGDKIVAEEVQPAPNNRIILAFQPKRTGDYLIWITAENRAFAQFGMTVAPVKAPSAIQLASKFEQAIDRAVTLKVDLPLDTTGRQFGPYQDFAVQLTPGREYTVTLESAEFKPVLRLDDNKPMVHPPPDKFPRRVAATIRAANDGRLRIRVSSEQFGMGMGRLKIEPTTAPPPGPAQAQRVLAALDDKGAYQDERAFSTTDAVVPGRGFMKEYLIGLERGKRYRVESSHETVFLSLVVYDPQNLQAAADMARKDASIVITANATGTYRIHVMGPMSKNRTPYTLRVTTLP
jgi:hypothetical protein